MKSSVSESKPFQSRSKGEIPGQARRKERLSRSKLKQAFLIDSDAELFMYLIQCIRFGSWKVRRLNRALMTSSFEEHAKRALARKGWESGPCAFLDCLGPLLFNYYICSYIQANLNRIEARKTWFLGATRSRTFHEPNLIRIKTDPNYIDPLSWFRRRS